MHNRWTLLGIPHSVMLNQEYCHGVLDTFLRRLPPRNREDCSRYLEQLRLPSTANISDFALLGYSQAKLPGDGFSLIHPFDSVTSSCELMTEIAGFRHQEGVDIEQLEVGTPVELVPEPDNPVDPRAISVMVGPLRIGYINRGQINAFTNWLQHNHVEASIERINGTQTRPLIYLFVQVRSKQASIAA